MHELRKEAGLTQEDLAQLAQLDGKHLQLVESGKTNPTLASLVGLTHALGLTLSGLLEGV